MFHIRRQRVNLSKTWIYNGEGKTCGFFNSVTDKVPDCPLVPYVGADVAVSLSVRCVILCAYSSGLLHVM
jgi:hypothetical protein